MTDVAERMGRLGTESAFEVLVPIRRGALPPSDASPQEKLRGQSPRPKRFGEWRVADRMQAGILLAGGGPKVWSS